MTINQEISTDYDHDSEDPFGPIEESLAQDFLMLDQNLSDINAFDRDLYQLYDTAIAVESFGMNPSAFGVMQATGLLSGTSLNALAMENFRFEGPGDPETDMAMEALTDKIKAKGAEWSAKVLSFAKTMADKVVSGLSSLWTVISEQSKSLTSKAWDKTKAAGRTIKAHPYKTVFAVVAAAAAVAAIVAMTSTGNYANESAMKSFLYKMQDMINKIKWPFGSVVADVAEDGSKILCHTKVTAEAAKAAAKAGEIGWTESAVKAVTGELSKVWNSLKNAIGGISAKVVAAAKFADIGGEDAGNLAEAVVKNKTKSKLVGWAGKEIVKRLYQTALWSVVGTLYLLLKNIVLRAFTVVKDTFTSLKPVAQAA